MLNRLMITAATAALIAGTGFANAQGMNREAPSAGAGMQQSAPSPDRGSPAATPMNRDSAQDQGMKSTQSDEKMQPKGGKNQQTQGDMKAGPKGDNKGEKSAQDTNTNNNMKGDKPNAMSSQKAEDRNGSMKADSKGADSKSQTVGQAGAGAKLSGEQRTKITTVIRNQHVAPVTNVNFSISVGTRVPRDVAFHPLPAEIVTIYPDWRGYQFILVNDQIVVVDPQSFEIIAVIDA
ncbi:DUF1236 domain-containing protein [Bradyrhizobium sp. dw_411]|uniref:DUF1236 domain-containing protein n=1 Tax=Bradyrhizobium sp. dw_411 TaxID=2720082 RepID=UPI001BD19D35|nr:DUF1236 domain-containing protein [Bradyrhizobium sp. dw_411]